MSIETFSLIDAHCHLQDSRYAGRQAEVVARALSAGVTTMVCCGVEESDWPVVAACAQRFPSVVPSFGIHPWYVGAATENWEKSLNDLLTDTHAGLGEIGLDFAIKTFDRGRQEYFFNRQLALACRLRRPVTIHCRQAWARLLTILREYVLPAGGLIHAYSGDAELVPGFEKMGLSLSFGGTVTRLHNRRGHAALQRVSVDRLLIETDSPDLTPAGCNTPLNEPANLPVVARQAAMLRQITIEELTRQTSLNAKIVFGIS
jgi:TatD DNase family protein